MVLMRVRTILFILVACYSISAFSAIQLNVSMVNKKGIDEKLVLVSEHHSSEILISGEWTKIEMKDGPTLFVKIDHYSDKTIYGPSDYVSVEGQISPRKGTARQKLSGQNIIVKLGETKSVVIKPNQDQQLEIIFSPKMIP